MNKLLLFTMLVSCFSTNCKSQTSGKSSYNDNEFYQAIEDKDSVLIRKSLNKDDEYFNLLLSRISKKEKIDIRDWGTKYAKRYHSAEDIYIKYRLIVFYRINLKKMSSWERRLDFFISAVYNNDYEVLNLLDFEDKALDGDSCYGITILTAAIYENNVKMVKYLLNRGVDKSKREFAACYDEAKEGVNAYEAAVYMGNEEMMDLLK
jgi:hypothetical protein